MNPISVTATIISSLYCGYKLTKDAIKYNIKLAGKFDNH